MRKSSHLEQEFLTYWASLGGHQLTPEYRFHPVRRWRFDFADVAVKVAIEVEGGIFSFGRHSRGAGLADDCEKYNAAALAGWRVFRLTERQLRSKEDFKASTYLTKIKEFILDEHRKRIS